MAIEANELALDRVRALAAASPGLRMLILFGSRARGDAWAQSDWDLAYAADPGFDADHCMSAVADLLAADRIALVDRHGARAGGRRLPLLYRPRTTSIPESSRSTFARGSLPTRSVR